MAQARAPQEWLGFDWPQFVSYWVGSELKFVETCWLGKLGFAGLPMDSIQGRLVRVLRLLLRLQSGPRYNAAQLAAELGVSRRTIFRDVNLLRDSGIPVAYDEKVESYILAESFPRPKVPSLSTDELAMLLLCAQLAVGEAPSVFGNRVREASAKLLADYPADVRREISRLLATCTTRYSGLRPEEQTLLTLFVAIRAGKQVRISRSKEHPEVFETKVAPYRVFESQGSWRLIGRSSLHRRTESFEVKDITAAEVTDDEYILPRRIRERLYYDLETGDLETGDAPDDAEAPGD